MRHISPGPVGHESGPRLVSVGEQAAAIAAQVLPTAEPVVVATEAGMVQLRPGSIWDGERMLVYASPTLVYFTVGDQLYESGTSGFVQERSQNVRGRFKQELPSLCLSHRESVLLQSLFVPWYMVLNLDVAKIGLFYYANRNAIEELLHDCPYLLQMLIQCQRRYPRLFDALPPTTGAGQIMTAIPITITGENVALFIARAIKADSPGRTLGGLRRIILFTIDIVKELVDFLNGLFEFVVACKATGLALLLMGIPLGALLMQVDYDDLKEKTMSVYSSILVDRMAEEGCTLSEPEARLILEELIWDPHTVIVMEDLERAIKGNIPALEQLHGSYSQGN
jgi:hypothetical protein